MTTQSWIANTAAKSSAAPLDGTEILRVGDSGTSKNATTADLRAYAGMVPIYVSGRWYLPPTTSGTLAAGLAFGAANVTRLCPGIIDRAVTISELACNVTTADAGQNIQLGIYNSSATTGYPTTLVGNTGSISLTGTGVKSAALAGGNTALIPGLYWFGANTSSTAVCCARYATGLPFGSFVIGSTTAGNVVSNGTTVMGLTTPETFNTWTADITANSFTELTGSQFAAVAFKVA